MAETDGKISKIDAIMTENGVIRTKKQWYNQCFASNNKRKERRKMLGWEGMRESMCSVDQCIAWGSGALKLKKIF